MSGYLRSAPKSLPKNSPGTSKPPGFAVLAELWKYISKLKVEYNMGADLLRPIFFFFPFLLSFFVCFLKTNLKTLWNYPQIKLSSVMDCVPGMRIFRDGQKWPLCWSPQINLPLLQASKKIISCQQTKRSSSTIHGSLCPEVHQSIYATFALWRKNTKLAFLAHSHLSLPFSSPVCSTLPNPAPPFALALKGWESAFK